MSSLQRLLFYHISRSLRTLTLCQASQGHICRSAQVVLRSDKYLPCFRPLSLSSVRLCQPSEEEGVEESKDKTPSRKVVDVDTSIKYLESKAYHMTYGDQPVWVPYRRNFKGRAPPKKTRRTCIRKGEVSTGNPCPICRDEYLVVHAKNVGLLKQFISPYSGQLLSYEKTKVCQTQHRMLLVALQQAWDKGYLDMPLPFRSYDYSQYYPEWDNLSNRKTADPSTTTDLSPPRAESTSTS